MKNKVLSLFFVFILLFVGAIVINSSVSAYYYGDYSYYQLSDGTVEITGYYGTDNNITIPTKVDGYKVTAIGDSAFWYSDTLKSITIPNTVTTIGDSAFYNCSNLTSVTIPDTVTSIGSYAFYGCSSLTSITLPSKLSSIEDRTFYRCSNLTNITIPYSVTYIDDYALYGCDSLARINILNPSCSISEYMLGYGDFPANLTIYADENSSAQSFANYNDINFVAEHVHTVVEKDIKPATTTKNGKIVSKCYCGETVKTLTVYDIGSISLSTKAYTYDGTVKKPSVIIKNSQGDTVSAKNYTVSYEKGRKNAGEYTVTIKFTRSYSGTAKRTFTIKRRTLKQSSLKLADIIYTGKTTKPKISYKGKTLKAGTDYKITKISKNKSIGTASVTVKMLGNYSGTIRTSYKIVPNKVKGLALKARDTSSITLKWSKVKGADGYKVYRWSDTKEKYVLYKTTTSTSMKVNRCCSEDQHVFIMIRAYKKSGGKTYNGPSVYYYNCVKPAKLRYTVNCSNIGKLRINYKGINNYKYIQIQLCINKSFNDEKYDVKNFYEYMSPYYINKYTEIYNLMSNKNYYVRCREYVYSRNGNPVYGAWGDAKKVYIQ